MVKLGIVGLGVLGTYLVCSWLHCQSFTTGISMGVVGILGAWKA